jgi:hypothetical protein
MRKTVSTTWPWDHDEFSQEDVVEHAKILGVDEICIRTPEYLTPYNPDWHKRLAVMLQAEGIDVSIWPVVAFRFPAEEAAAIRSEISRYGAVRVYLDAEIKTWASYIDEFLSALGRLSVPVGLGSFRRANYHTEMRWQTWLKAKVDGVYQIDFLAHQLYPIGWTHPTYWVDQFRQDIDSHEFEAGRAGRPSIPWMPWMPAFVAGSFEGTNAVGWHPEPDELHAAIEYMKNRLGARLLGLNWWSFDSHLALLPNVYDYIEAMPSSEDPPSPVPPPTKPKVTVTVQVQGDVDVIMEKETGT